MIDRIIHFSIHNKLVVGLMVLGLIAWGGYSVTQLPIDAVPDITNNQVQIITVTPSLAAQEVERLITFPVEITMATIPSIEEVRSFSRFGLSVVTIVFEENIDVYWARQQVSERISKAKSQIPDGIGTPELAPVTTGLGEIYQYVVHTEKGYADKYTAMELRTIQDWIIKRQLLGIPGVADVSSFGGYLKQYEIAINPEKLRSMELTFSDIFTALEKNNHNTGGAYIDKKPNAYFIRAEGMIESREDIEQIVVKATASGVPVLIRDVADVQLGSAVRYGATTRNGEGEVVSAIVMMLKGENSAKVITAIKERIEQIKKTLPEGVTIEPFLDRSKLVNNAIGTVTQNLVEGALVVLFILVLFLGNLRAGLVVASVIPLAMLFAFGMMNVFGVSGNLMSLGAIDFGLIVDGAVIIVESIVHRLALSGSISSRKEMDSTVYGAAAKIRSSAAFGEIIILIVYLPILALVGVEGKMFRPMAQTVSFAILGAFILSLTYVPMMSALALSRKRNTTPTISDRMIAYLQKVYRPVLEVVLKRKAIVVLIAFIFFGLTIITFNSLGGEFIPSLDEGDFAVETRVMTGSSLTTTIEAATKAEKILLDNFPEVKQVVGKIGSGEIPTDPMPIEACDLMIILKDKDEWVSADSREELAEKMGKALSVIPGVTFGFQQPIQMRFNELMTGARQDVVIKVYGEDLQVLSQSADRIGKLVNTVEGAEDLYIEQVDGLPQIQISYNRAELAKHGLNIKDINTVIETAFAGKVAGMVYEGERRFELVVRLNAEHRMELEDVKNLFVKTPNGMQLPLEQVAHVRYEEGPNQIQRDDTKRRITIGLNVRNRDVESVVADIRAKVEADIKLPPGYYVTYGGQFQNLVEARQRLSIAVPIALLLIFVLLYFTFKSMKQAILIFTAIPLSAIGGVYALYLRDMPFSISAGVGFIALFGVAVLNGIVLIAEFNHLKREGVADIRQQVLQGTVARLRPVLMTAMVASFGFLPMALSTSSGSEVQRPLATVVIGGLLTATLLTLFVLPVLYCYLEKGIRLGKAKTVAVLLFILPLSIIAQQPRQLSLEEAISLALQNNPQVRVASLEVERQQQLSKAAISIDKTQLSWQHGQYNSYNSNDNYFSVSQTFAFPTVYARNAQVANAQVQSSELKYAVTQNELKARVKQQYYRLLYLDEREKLYRQLDSLYTNMAKAADLRYRTGESSLLEKTTAETHLAETQNRLQLIASDKAVAMRQLQVLLQTEETLQLSEEQLKRVCQTDTVTTVQNPTLAYLKHRIQLHETQQKLARSQLLPDITLGYFNQSLIGSQGINGENRYFGPSDRFSGFQVGVSIPLWAKPQTARIKAAGIEAEVARIQFQGFATELQGQYDQAIQTYLKYKNSLNYFETHALQQASLILDNAQKAYESGSIGYFEYTQAHGQSTDIRLNWLQTLDNYNQAIIQLEFLSNN